MVVWLWIGFIAFVLGMLALDLGVLNRGAHVIRTKQALVFSAVCAALALAFAVLVYFIYANDWLDVQARVAAEQRLTGLDASMKFLAGWIIEQSLSLDNIFVIAMIFSYFGVPLQYQHRALFWGIMGALVMRMGMILIGATLIAMFTWTIYVFGGLLIFTAWKMFRSAGEKVDPDRNPLVILARRVYPVSSQYDENRFFTSIPATSGEAPAAHLRAATPLFLALVAIESTDVLFAVDSIPAIFAITKDPFIVFTSNVFAILNLRSLYFILADLLDRFRLLKYSLVFVLAYVGVKMMLSHHYVIPTGVSLAIIATALLIGVIASLRAPPSGGGTPGRDEPHDRDDPRKETQGASLSGSAAVVRSSDANQ